MTAATFNTLKLSETLHEAGMPEVQAKAVSHALHETLAEFSTKRDLREAVEELRADFRFRLQSFQSEVLAGIQSGRTGLDAEIQSVRGELQGLRSELGAEINSVRAEVQTLRTELGAEIQSVRAETRSVRSDLGAGIKLARTEIGSEIQALRAEVREIEPRLMIRLGGTVVVALGAFTALSKWIG